MSEAARKLSMEFYCEGMFHRGDDLCAPVVRVIDFVLARIREDRDSKPDYHFTRLFLPGARYGPDPEPDVYHRPLHELTTDQLLAELHSRGVLRFSDVLSLVSRGEVGR